MEEIYSELFGSDHLRHARIPSLVPKQVFEGNLSERGRISPPPLMCSRTSETPEVVSSGAHGLGEKSQEMRNRSTSKASSEQKMVFDHFCKFSFMRSHLSRANM